jgi:hypothetical protein
MTSQYRMLAVIPAPASWAAPACFDPRISPRETPDVTVHSARNLDRVEPSARSLPRIASPMREAPAQEVSIKRVVSSVILEQKVGQRPCRRSGMSTSTRRVSRYF